ncbi:MAG: hypothetical protein EOO07_36710 [Chitinophagaceae bacterium]|nr:MAG: hypothetical protein EOO07_36710 [Chitinophagaceae bacterium]
MKYIFTLLAALFLASAGLAQTVTWCPPGAEWYFNAYHQSFSGYSHVKYEGDTIIDGQACKRLSERFKGTNYFSGDTSESFKDRYTYESNGVVYALNENPGQGWDTLYNFNAVPGDGWRIKDSYGDYFYFQISDTGSTTKQGYQLKWFNGWISYTDVVWSTDTIFERIGMSGNIIGGLTPVFAFANSLCNYSDSSFTNWPNSDAFCAVLPPVSRPEEIS